MSRTEDPSDDRMKFDPDDPDITVARDAQGVAGPDEVLLASDDNLLAGTPYDSDGYVVAPFLDPDDWASLKEGARVLIRDRLRAAGATVPESFRLQDYHRHIAGDQERHLQVVRPFAAGMPVDVLNIDPSLITERIGELLGKPLTLRDPSEDRELYCMRAVRPRSKDNNPLHRDAWLPHLRNAVNLYVPLAGSDERSSLALVPGSHHWSEADTSRTAGGAVIDSVRFSVPSLVAAKREVHVIRPNPGENEVLVFSPYALHGGATNLNEDRTRVSLEIRLWRVDR